MKKNRKFDENFEGGQVKETFTPPPKPPPLSPDGHPNFAHFATWSLCNLKLLAASLEFFFLVLVHESFLCNAGHVCLIAATGRGRWVMSRPS